MKRLWHRKERQPPEVAAENHADVSQIEIQSDTSPTEQAPPALPVILDEKEKASEESSDRSTPTSSGNEKSGDEVHEIRDENGKTIDEKHDEVVRTDSTATASTEGEGPGEDDESKYPRALPLAILTLGLCLSTFVVALDNTIIATAIPRITTVFDSLNDVGWYGSSYLLTTTSLQPSFGKIYTYFNIKWTFITAVFIFEVGSVLCAAAQSSTMLIVGRAVAGVGAAAIFSGGMTIVGYTVPLRKRPIYIGLLSSMFGISSVIGPILGGAFTDKLTWRCKYP
jgi:fucose permease